MSRFKFPSAYSVLFLLIIISAAASWIVPAGEYDRVYSDVLDREVPVAGSYHTVEANPQGIVEILLAPIAGFYNPSSYEANAIDVALFVLIIGGFLAVVTRTGAISSGIQRAMKLLSGHEILMIPFLMLLFAAGGTVYGMAEETIPFYMLLIPIVIAAGYDAIVGVSVILIGAGIGVLGSTINPFATVIASNAAGIDFTQGQWLRFVILVLGWVICTAFVMLYAHRVKANPEHSVIAEQKTANEKHFSSQADNQQNDKFTITHGIVLLLFIATFGCLVWGVSTQGWWMAEISALFLAAAIVIAVVARMSESVFTDTFIDGARDLLGVALIIGIARGIVVILDNGMITGTILSWSEQAVSGFSNVIFINAIYWVEVLLSFLVPSTSGLAVLSMPILAPLGDFAGVGRDLIVTAYQSASGIVNLITPTSGVVMGALAIARVSYLKWLQFIWPLLLMLTVMIMLCLSLGTFAASY